MEDNPTEQREKKPKQRTRLCLCKTGHSFFFFGVCRVSSVSAPLWCCEVISQEGKTVQVQTAYLLEHTAHTTVNCVCETDCVQYCVGPTSQKVSNTRKNQIKSSETTVHHCFCGINRHNALERWVIFYQLWSHISERGGKSNSSFSWYAQKWLKDVWTQAFAQFNDVNRFIQFQITRKLKLTIITLQ